MHFCDLNLGLGAIYETENKRRKASVYSSAFRRGIGLGV